MRICRKKDPNPEAHLKLINHYVKVNNPAIQEEELREENKSNLDKSNEKLEEITCQDCGEVVIEMYMVYH
jgi:hypothetical protein